MTSSLHRRLRILLIDAGLPNPEFDAGSRAIIDFIDIIQEGSRSEDPEIHFLTMGHNEWGRESDLIQRKVRIHWPKETLLSTEGQSSWLDALAPDIVVVSRPWTASQLLSTVMARKEVGNGPRFLYYGHDIHHQRLAQQLRFDTQPALGRQQRLYQVVEHAIWNCFTTVIYGSRSECKHVNRIFPNKAVYLPLYVVRETQRQPPFTPNFMDNTPFILWVGGAHHASNRDGLSWLIREIFSYIDASIVLSVVGDWPIQVRQGMDYQPSKGNHEVRWLGKLEQNSLEQAYQTCDFSVATLRFGGGVKGKVFEAIARQCPVLTTPIGAQGLEHLDWPKLCLSEANPQAIAEKIEKLLAVSPRKQFANKLQSMQSVLVHESKLAPHVWSDLI